MHCSSRVSACRRELNSHDAAEPQELSGPRQLATPRESAELKVMENKNRAMSRGAATKNDKVLPCQIEPPHCVGGPGLQSVCGAAAANTAASCFGRLRRRLEHAARHGLQPAAGGDWCSPPEGTGLWRAHRQRSSGAALPNPSFKRSANGRPPSPGWRYAVHFRQPGPGVLPSSPA